jgi:hypothetical protein
MVMKSHSCNPYGQYGRFSENLLRLFFSFDGAIIPDESAAHAIYQFEAHGCDAAFYRTYLSPKGFVLPAEGFSPAARVVGQPAAGLKPSAPTTKADTQRGYPAACSQNRAAHLRPTVLLRASTGYGTLDLPHAAAHAEEKTMQDYEKLGAFYLDQSYDLEKGARRDNLILYDAKDLTTHAMII